ncbi:hypothetical protein KCU93_g266, partial [Aureobasidium melanogenum]
MLLDLLADKKVASTRAGYHIHRYHPLIHFPAPIPSQKHHYPTQPRRQIRFLSRRYWHCLLRLALPMWAPFSLAHYARTMNCRLHLLSPYKMSN